MSPEQGKRSRWWWVPGTAVAVISAMRFAYQILRDHHYLF
ncbi:hypothetical protein SAMN05421811_10161 [Nonomuraea wenchangensis]|uniref:Uncharacterized protein n=1 Tax=Nonomuraea wenchangensis TaxID=568860 RepID=A0A1H9YJ11_9ACTN|nr:hypothetical protein SAMN05421811_10161 [Nonomuraea wenchangensis]